MILVIVISLLLVIVGWILVARIELTIDTLHNEYKLCWYSIGSARLIPQDKGITLLLNCFGWSKEMDLLTFLARSSKRKPTASTSIKQRKIKAKNAVNRRIGVRKMIEILRTFRVRKCYLELDTDDFILNSFLFPLAHFLHSPTHQLKINYQGNTHFSLIIDNRLYRPIATILFS